MVTREIAEWSKTDASNDFTAEEGGWVEGMKRSDVNDAARADMGALRRFYDDPEWLNLTVNASLNVISATQLDIVAQNATSYFTAGRRVKITGGTPTPVFATVVSSDFGDPDTQVFLSQFDGHTGVPVTPTLVELHHSPSITSAAFLDSIFVRVTTLTGAAIQDAIDLMESNEGGIIVLEPKGIYIVSEKIKIGEGNAPGFIRIMGRGATLVADSGVDGGSMFQIQDDIGAQLDINVIIEDVVFDGNSSVMTSASDGFALLQIGIRVKNVWVRGCGFIDSHSDLLSILQNCQKIWISDCLFTDAGEDCIVMEDDVNDVEEIFIRGCSFRNPANNSSFSEGAGIHFAGKVHISDCSITLLDHATDTQIGIRGAVKTSGSLPDASGRESSIVGCRIEGTGLNARGIWLQGRDCKVVASTIRLSGAGTEGVQVEYVGNESERHIIQGNTFIECQHAVRLEPSAEDCIVSGNIFEDCPFPITDSGQRNKINGNTMTNGIDGITLSATADESIVSLNTADTMSSDGIVVESGAADVLLLHNMNTGITSSIVNDSGTRTGIISAESAAYVYARMTSDGTVTNVDTTEQFVPNSQIISLSGSPWADGSRIWVLDAVVQWSYDSAGTSGQDVQVRFKMGTNTGTPASDPDIIVVPTTSAEYTTDTEQHVSVSGVEFTPDSSDDVFLSVSSDAAGPNNDITVSGDSAKITFISVRPR